MKTRVSQYNSGLISFGELKHYAFLLDYRLIFNPAITFVQDIVTGKYYNLYA